MFGIMKKNVIVLLTKILVNVSNRKKCVFLNNQKCEIQPTFINLHPNEHNEELHYHSHTANLLKAVILLMTYLTESVFQIKQKI